MCWDVSSYEAQAPVLLWGCHGSQGNQLWRYDPVIHLDKFNFRMFKEIDNCYRLGNATFNSWRKSSLSGLRSRPQRALCCYMQQ